MWCFSRCSSVATTAPTLCVLSAFLVNGSKAFLTKIRTEPAVLQFLLWFEFFWFFGLSFSVFTSQSFLMHTCTPAQFRNRKGERLPWHSRPRSPFSAFFASTVDMRKGCCCCWLQTLILFHFAFWMRKESQTRMPCPILWQWLLTWTGFLFCDPRFRRTWRRLAEDWSFEVRNPRLGWGNTWTPQSKVNERFVGLFVYIFHEHLLKYKKTSL